MLKNVNYKKQDDPRGMKSNGASAPARPTKRFPGNKGIKKLGSIPLYDHEDNVKSPVDKANVNDGNHQLGILEKGERVLNPAETRAYDAQHSAHGPLMSVPDAMSLPKSAFGSIPVFDEGGDVDTNDSQTKSALGNALAAQPSQQDENEQLIQQDKEDAAKKGDLVGLGKAVLNEKHFTQPDANAQPGQFEAPLNSLKAPGLGSIALPPTSEPQPPTEMHQDVAGGPLVSGAPTNHDKGTTRDFASMEHKAKLSDYDTRIQQALDSGTPEGQTQADRLRAAKTEYQKQNPWDSAGNHPGILGKIAHVAAGTGNIAGNILSPALMELIPGTDLNRRARAAGLGRAISQDTEDELRLAQAGSANAKETTKPKLLTEAGNTYTASDGTRYQRYAMPDGSAQWFPEGQAPGTTGRGLGSIALPQGGYFGAEKPNTSEQDKNRWSTLLSKKQRGEQLSAQEQQDYKNLASQMSIGQSRATNINKNIDSILKDRSIPQDQWDSYHIDADTAPEVAKDAEHQADVRSNEVWTSGQPARQQTAEERKQDEKDRRAMVYAEDANGQTIMVSQYDFDHSKPGSYLGSAEPVKSGDLAKDRTSIRMLNDVQTNVSRYRDGIQSDAPHVSDQERKLMTELEAINKQAGGDLISSGASAEGIHVSGAFPQWSAQISSRQYDRAQQILKELSNNTHAMDLYNSYLRVAASVPAYQKSLTNIGRANKEMMELELANVPMPYYDPRTAASRMDAFQQNVDAAKSGFPTNLPGMRPLSSSHRANNVAAQAPPAGATGTAMGSDGNLHYHDKAGKDLGIAPRE